MFDNHDPTDHGLPEWSTTLAEVLALDPRIREAYIRAMHFKRFVAGLHSVAPTPTGEPLEAALALIDGLPAAMREDADAVTRELRLLSARHDVSAAEWRATIAACAHRLHRHLAADEYGRLADALSDKTLDYVLLLEKLHQAQDAHEAAEALLARYQPTAFAMLDDLLPESPEPELPALAVPATPLEPLAASRPWLRRVSNAATFAAPIALVVLLTTLTSQKSAPATPPPPLPLSEQTTDMCQSVETAPSLAPTPDTSTAGAPARPRLRKTAQMTLGEDFDTLVLQDEDETDYEVTVRKVTAGAPSTQRPAARSRKRTVSMKQLRQHKFGVTVRMNNNMSFVMEAR